MRSSPDEGIFYRMVSAWLYNESEEDCRLAHKKNPNVEVTASELADLGVLQWTCDPASEMDKIEEITKERSYSSRDIITISKEKLPNYEEKLKIFFTEHLHDDGKPALIPEEIRYILEGEGYFDIRNQKDEWVRILCGKGDMIILPAGSYHRFTLSETNYVQAMRLFKEVFICDSRIQCGRH